MLKKLLAFLFSVFFLFALSQSSVWAQDIKIQSITLHSEKTTLKAKEPMLILKTVFPEDVADPRIAFSSSNPDVATVSEYGVVTGVSDGTAAITATAMDGSGVSASCGITVKTIIANSFSFIQDNITMTGGSVYRIQYTLNPEDSVLETLDWSSSNESVATVDHYGVVSGIKKGNATITATNTATGQKQSCRVTVNRGPLPPLSELGDPEFHFDERIFQRYTEDPNHKNTARIMFTGDIMCLSSQQSAAKTGSTFDFNKSFQLVKGLFEDADFVIGNLETTISYSNPYTCEVKERGGNPHNNSPSTFLDALRYAGMDAVVSANNHACDSGAAGIQETLDLLDTYRIAHTGTFRASWQKHALQVKINGIQVAFLAYSELFNHKDSSLTQQQREGMLSPYSKEAVVKDVQEAKANGAEFVIAYNHWGTENTHNVTSSQGNHAQEMADAGVDLIIGSHPHVLQKADMIQAKDGRKVLVIYSMGNFISSMGSTDNNDSIVLDVSLKKENGKVILDSAGYYPCKVIGSYKGASYCVVPVSTTYNGGDASSSLQSAQNRIANIMGNDIRLRK